MVAQAYIHIHLTLLNNMPEHAAINNQHDMQFVSDHQSIHYIIIVTVANAVLDRLKTLALIILD